MNRGQVTKEKQNLIFFKRVFTADGGSPMFVFFLSANVVRWENEANKPETTSGKKVEETKLVR